MKLKLFVLAFVALIPQLSFAQSALTIFSEDGDKFILYLNAVQQNSVPQANLRIDGLMQPYYKAKIVFEDKSKGQVDKNIPVNDPQTNAPADVVYRIKNKDGEMKLRYYSAQPVPPNYVAPPDVYVMHYGQPDPGVTQTTVTQTTTTTTGGGNTGGGNVSIGFGAGGNGGVNMNMNVNVNDPNMTTQQTTTTTTTTSSYSNSTTSGYSAQPAATNCQYAMDRNSFTSAKETIKKDGFDETKLSTAKSILASNCVSADQVVQICQLFGFEQTKLDFAKFAYSKTVDPNNYFKVNNVFSFDASKTELNDYISSGR